MASRAPANRQSRLTHTPSFSRADRRAQPGQIRAGQLGTTKSSPHFFAKDLLLLLAFALSLRRMLVRYLRMGLSVASVLLGSRVIAFGMMLGSGPMRLGSLIVLLSRLFVHFLWHEIAPLSLGLMWKYVRSPAAASYRFFCTAGVRRCPTCCSRCCCGQSILAAAALGLTGA